VLLLACRLIVSNLTASDRTSVSPVARRGKAPPGFPSARMAGCPGHGFAVEPAGRTYTCVESGVLEFIRDTFARLRSRTLDARAVLDRKFERWCVQRPRYTHWSFDLKKKHNNG
jgi:hypothetical protein